MKMIEGGVTAAKGFLAGSLLCGIKKGRTKPDLALIYSPKPCAAAAVYTKNLVKGAPITVTKEHLTNGYAQAVICNSGNANTCNADGEEKARRMCRAAADALGIDAGDVIVASTGVIGQPLDVALIEAKQAQFAQCLSSGGGEAAATAIMTTDTRKKEAAVLCEIGGTSVRIGGMCKGSGMIEPNMATMLGFITTDACISPGMLHKALVYAVDRSFNCVSIDGDTSTNDMVAAMANGEAGNVPIESEGTDFDLFAEALLAVCTCLARETARDGEGATRLLCCRINHFHNREDALRLAKSVINSSLVKSAFFGADANWGRILCALGYAGIDCCISKIDVSFSSNAGRIDVCKGGVGLPFDEEEAKRILLENEIEINVNMNDGDCEATAWGCDLTYDYVKINGDYRT